MICFFFPFFTFFSSIRDERQKELKKLQATSKEEMWLHDLDEFVAKLDEVEAKENQETKDNQETQQKGFKKVGTPLNCFLLSKPRHQVAGKKGMVKAETQPSAHGIRIEPRVDDELKQKVKQFLCFPLKSPGHPC